MTSAQQRIGVLAALLWRGTSVQPFIAEALKDSDDRVRQMAIRAITEQNIKAAREDLNASLGSQSMSPRLLGMTIAAINFLDGDRSARIDSGKINAVLLARLNGPQSTDVTKANALHMLQAGHPRIAPEQLSHLFILNAVLAVGSDSLFMHRHGRGAVCSAGRCCVRHKICS